MVIFATDKMIFQSKIRGSYVTSPIPSHCPKQQIEWFLSFRRILGREMPEHYDYSELKHVAINIHPIRENAALTQDKQRSS